MIRAQIDLDCKGTDNDKINLLQQLDGAVCGELPGSLMNQMAKPISNERVMANIAKGTLNKEAKPIIRHIDITNHKNLFSLSTSPHPPGSNYNRDYQD